jgi:hypothetical protein
MIQSNSNREGDLRDDVPRFAVVRNGQHECLTASQLFVVAYGIWHKGDYKTAKTIFEQLSAETDCLPRVRIFLASCQVMLGDYSACSATLVRALPKDIYGDAAARLHDAFVLWKVGLYVDVKDSLKSLAMEHAELPSLNLLLAELLRSMGADGLSERFFRRAIHYDDPHGGVRRAARLALESISGN